MAKPEMTMFYVIKAVNLHCDNGDCIFCEYHDFCKQVCGAVQYLRLHFPDDYNRLYNIMKEGKKNE